MAGKFPTIPPLNDSERIGDWRDLFQASVQYLLDETGGELRAIQLLPIYVSRRPAERELVKYVLREKKSLKEALDILESVLDPHIDPYSAMQDLCKLTWKPGDEIDDFFYTLIRKARDARSSLKFVASILSSQLPRDVQGRVKDTVQSIPENLESEEAHSFIQQVKLQLTERGYPLNHLDGTLWDNFLKIL